MRPRLPEQEVRESTSRSLSYYDSDFVVADWDAARVVDEPGDFWALGKVILGPWTVRRRLRKTECGKSPIVRDRAREDALRVERKTNNPRRK